MVNKRNFTLIQVHVLSFLKFSGIHLHLIDGLLHWLMLQIFIKNNVCIKKKIEYVGTTCQKPLGL